MQPPEQGVDRKSYRLAVFTLTVCGLVGNFFIYSLFNMVSVVGGPVACAGTMVFTLLLGSTFWFVPTRTFGGALGALFVAGAVWALGSIALLIALDPVQAWIWKVDTERVAKEYAGGSLPPGCAVEGTYRGSFHTPLECKDPVTTVAAWYRSKLSSEWVETVDDGAVLFTRQVSGNGTQLIRIYKDPVFVEGTAVLVRPTLSN